MLILLVCIIGFCVGSFLNVVIARVPEDQSVVRPPSACPTCQQQLRWVDNIPVVSWLLLRAKCRACQAPISWQYPAVETATAVVFGLVVWWAWGTQGWVWMTPVLLYFAAICVALTVIDLQVYRLPNAIVLPHVPVFLIAVPLASWLDGTARVVPALAGAVIFCGFLLTIHLIKPAGMGLGDVKLAPILGVFLGWQGWGAIPVGIFAGFLLGSVLGVG